MKTNYFFKSLLLSILSASVSAQVLDDQIKGFTEPWRSIDIAAPEMGTLSSILVEEGQRVESNMILARMHEEVLEASLAMANESQQAAGKLNSARAECRMQQERHEKLLGLFIRRHASQTELDRAKAQLEVATAQVEAVEDEMRIKALEINRIEAQLEQRRLRSPIDGVVTRIFKDEGEFVSANDPIVANVAQLDPLLVIFPVPQEHLSNLAVGQTIPLTIGPDNDRVDGVVEFISPTADAQSGTSRVKIRIDNSNMNWQSGVACHLNRQTFVTNTKSPNTKSPKKPDLNTQNVSSPIIQRSN